MNNDAVIDNKESGVIILDATGEDDLHTSSLQQYSDYKFINSGTIRLKATSQYRSAGINSLDNTGGTIEVEYGTLSLLIGEHTGGVLNVSANADLIFSGGIHTFSGIFTGTVGEYGHITIRPMGGSSIHLLSLISA